MIPMPFLIAGAWAYTKTSPKRHRRLREATSDMNSLLHDNIDGIQQIKAFTREEAEHARFNESSDLVRKATLHIMKLWALYNPSMEFCRNFGYALVIAFGAWSVMHAPDQASLEARTGVFVAFLVALNLFYEPISRLNGLNQIIQADAPPPSGFSRSSTRRKNPDSARGATCPCPCGARSCSRT